MAKSKKELFPILLDLHYKYSMNKFEEFYGDSVSYSSIEQESYIDLKEMSFDLISREIKFRKFGRQGNILTVKMDINTSDYESFLKIFREDFNNEKVDSDSIEKVNVKRFNFLHDFEISNIRDLTIEEKIRFKKSLELEEDEDSESLDIEDSEVEDMNETEF